METTVIHNIQQKTPEWFKLRASHDTASEAPAALGVSKYQTRSALLKQKNTGLSDDVDGAKQALFDRGHAAEESARAIAEEIIGEDLFPITATLTGDGVPLLASLDGATMDRKIIWEHKLYSALILPGIETGNLDPHYTVQMDQQLLVTGADKCLFMISDGTKELMAYCWYKADQSKFDALISGWKQFHADLDAYVPTASTVQAVAAPVESLPAVRVQLDGQLVVASNLPEFAVALRAFIERIPAKPSTDQEFADCEAACKSLKKAEDALESSETHALAQMTDVESMRRMVADLRNLARATRLASEKTVAARKESIRGEIVADGVKAMAEHITALNTRLGKPYMPTVAADFGGAIKGKRTVDSLRDAVSTTLANAKISASAIADHISINLVVLAATDQSYSFLFRDLPTIVLKDTNDFALLIKSRISEHQAAEAKKEAEQRERIRAEEVARLAREQEAADRLRIAQELEAAVQARDAAAKAITTAQATPVPAPVPAQAVVTHDAVVKIMMPATVAQAMKPETPPSLKLGQINERLAPIQISAEGLRTLGFDAARRIGASVCYHEADFPRICLAMVQHIRTACSVETV